MRADPDRATLRFRRRQDYAVELFRDIEAHLHDGDRVGRALLELGRFYNPTTDGPIVDAAARRRVLEAIAAGRDAEARAVLTDCLERYAGPGATPGPGGPGDAGPEGAGASHDAEPH
jgi:hypothetical protein